MSDASRSSGPSSAVNQTRQPFDLDDGMRARVEELGLAETVEQLRTEGYGYIHEAADLDFNSRLRDTIRRLSSAGDRGDRRGASMLLDKDPIFVDVVLNPKLLVLVEIMCGKGAMISQLAASVRNRETPPIGLHSDQNWFPAPFPVHNQLLTFCWATDEFNEENGSTKIIPRSHLERRHPTAEEIRDEPGSIPTECPAGSVVVWDGSVWHSNHQRTTEGERIVLHITYSRLALRPVECYDHLGEEWLKDRPHEMRVLLGREDFLNTGDGAYAGGYELIRRTFQWAKA